MGTCIKILKLIIALKGIEESKEAAFMRSRIETHLGECKSCASFWADLRSAEADKSRSSQALVSAGHISTLDQHHAGSQISIQRSLEMTNENGIGTEVEGKFFTLFVEGAEFHLEQSTITGGEIMDLAGIPRDEGLIEILEDGTQTQIGEEEVIELQPGRRFKKAPRFVRG